MKKMSILFITIVLALSLAACGVEKTPRSTYDESGIHTEDNRSTETSDDTTDATDSADASVTSGTETADWEQSDAYSEDNGERKTDGNAASDENDAETVGTAADVTEPHAAPAPETERDTVSESESDDVTERRESEKSETRAPETTSKPETVPAPETTASEPETVPTPETTASPSVERPAGMRYAEEVTRLVNEIRRKNGLSELTLDAELSRVAEAKSRDMSDRGYFAHESPTYGSPFDMMKSFGIRYRSAGENIARGYRTPEAVVDAWMNSEGHRANILSPKFTKIGVGYVADGNYWTQMFTG